MAASEAQDPVETSWGFEEGAPIGEGRFVLQRIGGGDLYDTYLVWDEHRFSIMVAKLIRPDRVEDESAQRAIRREATALTRLAHPVVVRSFDAVLDNPHPHLLLEHFEGLSLRQVVTRQGPLPLEQVIPLALYTASALHYFAVEGYVHLDVKPENIIMGVPPRLIDLSLVHSLADAAALRTIVGTDAFMPPEQAQPGEREPLGPPADVWGLAATVHYAITGDVPFPRPDADERYTLEDRFPQLVDDPLPLKGRAPDELAELIESTLRSAPDDRPTASEFANSLQPLMAALPSRFVMTRFGWRAQ